MAHRTRGRAAGAGAQPRPGTARAYAARRVDRQGRVARGASRRKKKVEQVMQHRAAPGSIDEASGGVTQAPAGQFKPPMILEPPGGVDRSVIAAWRGRSVAARLMVYEKIWTTAGRNQGHRLDDLAAGPGRDHDAGRPGRRGHQDRGARQGRPGTRDLRDRRAAATAQERRAISISRPTTATSKASRST